MATLTTQNMTKTGLAPTYQAAAAGGDAMPIAGDTDFLHVINGGGSSINVIIGTPGLVDGDLTVQDRTVAVTNGTNKMIPMTASVYLDPTTGLASWTYSATPTSVTIAAIRR